MAAALLLALAAQAEPVAKLKPSNYVNDFAGVLDQNTAAQMNEICKQVDEKAHAQIAVVTIHSLDGADIESYAVNLFHQWGVGSKSTDHGVLILYAIDDHRARVEVGYGLEAILPDGTRDMLNCVDRFDFNWHVMYQYEESAAPLLPAGTLLHLTAVHDNTAASRTNPSRISFTSASTRACRRDSTSSSRRRRSNGRPRRGST